MIPPTTKMLALTIDDVKMLYCELKVNNSLSGYSMSPNEIKERLVNELARSLVENSAIEFTYQDDHDTYQRVYRARICLTSKDFISRYRKMFYNEKATNPYGDNFRQAWQGPEYRTKYLYQNTSISKKDCE